jgi:hypothetical protein
MTEEERIGTLEHLLTNFRMMASDGITAEGSLSEGYAVDTSNLGGGVTGAIITGACCLENGSCTTGTEDACNLIGGVYQGDGTICSPNPCPGGPVSCNGCGFDAFDGSGRKFLTLTIFADGVASFTSPDFPDTGPATNNWSSVKIRTIDPLLACAEDCDCSGLAEIEVPWVGGCGSGTATASSCTHIANICPPGTSIIDESSGCGWFNDNGCNAGVVYACFGAAGPITTIISATQKQLDYDEVINPTQYVHATSFYELSNECIP